LALAELGHFDAASSVLEVSASLGAPPYFADIQGVLALLGDA
jgi:hypothetical protein